MMISIGLSASFKSQKPPKDDICVTVCPMALYQLLVDYEASNTYTQEEHPRHESIFPNMMYNKKNKYVIKHPD
jgi:hypothetical protein